MRSCKSFLFLVMTAMVLTGCATMFHTSSSTVRASSGASTEVEILAAGNIIYKGTLPAQVPVQSGWNQYTVRYTSADGEKRIFTISKQFNAWFIGSVFLGPIAWIIDLATGNIMTMDADAVLPIAYSSMGVQAGSDAPMIMLGENIPYDERVTIVGSLNNESEPMQ